jgi:hypothetical protein
VSVPLAAGLFIQAIKFVSCTFPGDGCLPSVWSASSGGRGLLSVCSHTSSLTFARAARADAVRSSTRPQGHPVIRSRGGQKRGTLGSTAQRMAAKDTAGFEEIVTAMDDALRAGSPFIIRSTTN